MYRGAAPVDWVTEAMPTERADPTGEVIAAWRTSDRVTRYLVEQLPKEVWPGRVPAAVAAGIWQWNRRSRE